MENQNAEGSLSAPLCRALAYERARSMSESIIAKVPEVPVLQKYAHDMKSCGLNLLLRHYIETDQIKARAYNSCRHRGCCPLCAIRAARVNAGEWSEKILETVYPQEFQLVTITQPPVENWFDALQSIKKTIRGFLKAWRNDAARGHHGTFFSNYYGGFYSIEMKTGKGSGLPHAHAHFLMHGSAMTTKRWVDGNRKPERHPLSVELRQRNPLGGYICDVRDMKSSSPEELKRSLMEVCKYLHDFKMTADEVWNVQKAVLNQRMTGSFGSLRGLKLKNTPDDVIDPSDAAMFSEYALAWVSGQFEVEETNLRAWEDSLDGYSNE